MTLQDINTIAEICDWAKISRSHLYAEMRRGRGPAVKKVGRRALITREAAEAWLDAASEQA